MAEESKAVPYSKFQPDFDYYGKPAFYAEMQLLDNEKNKEKFVKSIERAIRTSPEYRNYIKYLKTEALLNYCVLMGAMPEEVAQKLKIEMHHCPITLYDLVDTVLIKYLVLDKPFTRLSIANEVMDAHFMSNIGIVPMTVTAHQMAHKGVKLIKPTDIFGNFHRFLEQYENFVPEETRSKVAGLLALKSEFVETIRENVLTVDEKLFIEDDLKNYYRLEFNMEPQEVSEDEEKENDD
jgi:hypothetical protein